MLSQPECLVFAFSPLPLAVTLDEMAMDRERENIYIYIIYIPDIPMRRISIVGGGMDFSVTQNMVKYMNLTSKNMEI